MVQVTWWLTLVLWRRLLHVCEAIEALYEVCYGLGGLAFTIMI